MPKYYNKSNILTIFHFPFYKAETNNDVKEACYKCRICNKKFNRAERLSSHMTTHRGYDCTEPGCGKVIFFYEVLLMFPLYIN